MTKTITMETCTKCGSSDIDQGWLMSSGKIAYKSDKVRFQFSGGNVRTSVCLKCGYLESFVNPEDLEKLNPLSD